MIKEKTQKISKIGIFLITTLVLGFSTTLTGAIILCGINFNIGSILVLIGVLIVIASAYFINFGNQS